MNILILSDRNVGADRVADPGAARGRRPCTTTSCARARACRPGSSSSRASRASVHHFATLIGYGAAAVNPYLMLETLAELVDDGLAARRG